MNKPAPEDAEARRAVKPVICYPNDSLPAPDVAGYRAAFAGYEKVSEVLVPARDARCFRVPAGGVFRISSVEGPQVGDYLTFFAEIELLGALSACPGGDCSTTHSSDEASCHPLLVEVFEGEVPEEWVPAPLNGYDRSHGR